MNQNPLERQQAQINLRREQVRAALGRLFDDREGLAKKIELFISQLGDFEKGGIISDKDEITREVEASVRITDKETFITHLLKVLEPIIVAKITKPRIVSKIERNSTMTAPGNVQLSEVLYINSEDLNDKSNEIYIHLTSAKDFMTKDRVRDFMSEIEKGLIRLAEIITEHPNVNKIWASSWIVAIESSAKRLEEMGFSKPEDISEAERQKHFPDEKRPIKKAFVAREDFLIKYGKRG